MDVVTDAVRIAGEPDPGRLFLAGYDTTLLVDTTNGRLLRSEPGLRPVDGCWWEGWDLDPTVRFAVGAEATRLFVDPLGRLIRLDPDTGSRQVVLLPSQ